MFWNGRRWLHGECGTGPRVVYFNTVEVVSYGLYVFCRTEEVRQNGGI